MSFGFAGVHMLMPSLQTIPVAKETRILLLGAQDFALTYDQLVAFFRRHQFKFHDVPVAERRMTEGFAFVDNKDWWMYKDFIHQETLFKMLGFEPYQIVTLDVSDYEHADLIHDLNMPVLPSFGQFDFILNQGTLEHIFDIRQAMWNLSDLTKNEGQIVHMVPAGFLEHGFYNFNAGFFSDFYDQSRWKTEDLFYTFVSSMPMEGQSFYGRIDVNKLSSIPEGFYMNVFGRFRKMPGSTNPVATQSLYRNIHATPPMREVAEHKIAGAPKRSFLAIANSYLTKKKIKRRMKELGIVEIDA